MSRVIKIFDTTLRDGEQCPGASMNAEEKLEVAHQLARLRVDIIEAGFPISSPGDFASVQQIAREVRGPVICALARAKLADVDAAGESVRDAERPRIHVFIGASDIHIQHQMRKTREEVLEMAVAAVQHACKYVEDVEFSPMDASRADPDYLCRVVEAAIQAGATTVNIPDTVGYATPEEFAGIITMLKNRVPGIEAITLSCHCHDDLGLAVANSLAAAEAGCDQIECAVNGLGERAGNTPLEEVVMAIHTRGDHMGLQTNIETREIHKMSRLIRDVTGFVIPPNKAIVGSNAFAHASGIHQDGFLKERTTYEIMTPETVGLESSRLVLTARSGRHAFRARLQTLGYDLPEEEIHRAYSRFLEIADKKKVVQDEDLEAIVADQITVSEEPYELEYMTVMTGLEGTPTATIRLRKGVQSWTEAGMGVGSVDAVYRTIDKIIPAEHHLIDYLVSGVTGGTDALAEVTVKLGNGHNVFTGRASALDIVAASARAYLQAINKLVYYTENRSATQRVAAHV
jgi:2-isopropylmalate synthase